MQNKCIAKIIRNGLTQEELQQKFAKYVSLQAEAEKIAEAIGEQISNRVNDYVECTSTFDVKHNDWNVVSKTCFELGNFFGINGVPLEFDVTDRTPAMVQKLNKYFDKMNYGKMQIHAA